MTSVTKLKAEMEEMNNKIKRIQEECSHPSDCVTKNHGGSTGNPYERNEYWTDFTCSLCEKRWTLEGSH